MVSQCLSLVRETVSSSIISHLDIHKYKQHKEFIDPVFLQINGYPQAVETYHLELLALP